jgi:hypothetical protein
MQHQKMAQVEAGTKPEADQTSPEKSVSPIQLTTEDFKAIDAIIKKNRISPDILKDPGGNDLSLEERPLKLDLPPTAFRDLSGHKPLDLSLPSTLNRGPLYNYPLKDLAPQRPDNDLRIVLDRALTYEIRLGNTPMEMIFNPRKCGLRSNAGICFRTKIH